VEIHDISFDEALEAILALASGGGRHLVVTANVDHLVLHREDPALRSAYELATLRLADGAPLVALSRLVGTPLPGRVTGSDLLDPVCRGAAERRLSVYLLGGRPGSADLAAAQLAHRHPGLRLHAACPGPGFELDPAANAAVLADIRAATPNILFVCLGAPKQETWAAAHLSELPPLVAIGAGASVDYLSGATRRAPVGWQRLGLEWLFRLLQEPRRLWRRYLIRDAAFLGIAARDLWHSRRWRHRGQRGRGAG
jgi:N-acetylglucosaminyldiphosphoundecaprenol N-acetyl-beta-D-mannosaminyltransferase